MSKIDKNENYLRINDNLDFEIVNKKKGSTSAEVNRILKKRKDEIKKKIEDSNSDFIDNLFSITIQDHEKIKELNRKIDCCRKKTNLIKRIINSLKERFFFKNKQKTWSENLEIINSYIARSPHFYNKIVEKIDRSGEDKTLEAEKVLSESDLFYFIIKQPMQSISETKELEKISEKFKNLCFSLTPLIQESLKIKENDDVFAQDYILPVIFSIFNNIKKNDTKLYNALIKQGKKIDKEGLIEKTNNRVFLAFIKTALSHENYKIPYS